MKKTHDIIFVEKNTFYIFYHNLYFPIVIIFEFIDDDSQKFGG